MKLGHQPRNQDSTKKLVMTGPVYPAFAGYSPDFPQGEVRLTSTCEHEGHRQYVVTDSSSCSILVSVSICPFWQTGHSLVGAGLDVGIDINFT